MQQIFDNMSAGIKAVEAQTRKNAAPAPKFWPPLSKITEVDPSILNGAVIVFSHKETLAALSPAAKKPVILRNKMSVANDGISYWQLSRDGGQLAFAEAPGDVDFFDAGAHRSYVFIAPAQGRAKVFLAGYGPKAVDKAARYNYRTPSFDSSGQKMVMEEGQVAQFLDEGSPQWISVYDIAKRKRTFFSGEFIARLPVKERQKLQGLNFFAPALSPDGNDIVCAASVDGGHPYGRSYGTREKAPPYLIVHFDLRQRMVKVVHEIDDQLSVERSVNITYKVHGQTVNASGADLPKRIFAPQFAWHPTQRKFVFSGPAAPSSAGCNLFAYDIAAQKLTTLTTGTRNDKSPQWSLNGEKLWWLRDGQLFRGNSEGGEAENVFPAFGGIEKIQIVSKLKNWNPKIPIEARAGADK